MNLQLKDSQLLRSQTYINEAQAAQSVRDVYTPERRLLYRARRGMQTTLEPLLICPALKNDGPDTQGSRASPPSTW
jgi:hypothetical protein